MNNIKYTNPLFKKVRSQLGAPIVDVELTEEQMEDLLENAHDVYFMLCESDKAERNKYFKDFWVKQYFVALCKETLGRIRGKFNGKLSIPGSEVILNYKDLLTEAEREKQFLRYLILKDENILIENQQPILAAYIAVGNLEHSDIEKFIDIIKKKFSEDNLIKYFITVRGSDTRIECVYPINGIDASTKTSIANMEKLLIEITEEEEDDEQ
jgi:hypothetical protein